ncbi:von Willebrand factor A domain-containing protein 7-like [Aplochiton taeniatus]
MKTACLLGVWFIAQLGPSLGFKPLFLLDGQSVTHRDITQRAVLRKTAEVCRALAAADGRDFSLTISDSLSVYQLQRACSSDGPAPSFLSSVWFQTAIAKMYLSNAAVDAVFVLSARHHFDDETFQSGRELITAGVSAVKASVKLESFIAGRIMLGRILHTLQDFYSHSNWVELGNRFPYSTLIRPDLQMNNLADSSSATCRNCKGGNCTDNLLPELLQQGKLTSGYFNLFSSSKPAGKCSHGGSFDRTSFEDPVGGINKDEVGASHGHLHRTAADVAVNATMELLEDIRGAAGDKDFLRLMGLSQSSVLCFVIDTTGSMGDEIAEAKRVSFSIIDRKRGTQQEPSAYILVPFNDPEFGPLIKTTDADIFKQRINELTAKGGGDIPELCLSGLQLALTAAPPSSEIFVFTDAPAKDAELKSTITALIESSKSVVTFMLTDNLLSSRRRRRGVVGGTATHLTQSDAQLYRDLAEASGGQAIEVNKAELPQATSVIEDTTAGALVTVFQVSRNPGKSENFSFPVDGSLMNMTVYVTGGSLLTFNITNPTGVSQASSQSSGPLGSVSLVGNLRRLSVSATANQTGSWDISITSTEPYSVKVIGCSSLSFIYHFMEAFSGAHGDFSLMEGRPLTGGNVSLLVTMTGSDTVKVKEVALVETSGSREVNGTVQSLGVGNFLVTVDAVPQGVFTVRLRGEDMGLARSSLPSSFQRQASTQVKTSSISVTAPANISTVEPGSTVSVPFAVTTVNGTVGTAFTVRATNDRGFNASSPSSVSVAASGGGAVGTVTLDVPSGAASGSDVTLTIEAQDSAAADYNYAVLRLAVVATVISVSTCPSTLCGSARWGLTANLTDGANGTGIDRLTIRQGNGTLNSSSLVGATGENVTLAAYSASCCSLTVELVAVDKAGNVGTCLASAKTVVALVTTAAGVTNITALSVVATTSTGGRMLTPSRCLWIGVLFFLFIR